MNFFDHVKIYVKAGDGDTVSIYGFEFDFVK